jgi:hypothetical protein
MAKSTRASSAADYKLAVADLGKLSGAEPRAMKGVKGGLELRPKKGKPFKVERVQADFLQRGCFVFRTDALEKDRIAVLPTTDKYDAVAAMKTSGVNWNVDTKKVISWLRKLEKRQPFVITGASCEHVSGRFTTPIRNVDDLAMDILDFCPDLENPVEIAKDLRKKGEFMLWWT